MKTKSSVIKVIAKYLRPHKTRIIIAVFATVTSAWSVLAFGFGIGHLVNSGATIGNTVSSTNFSLLSIPLITLLIGTSSFIRMYFIGTCSDKIGHSIRTSLYNHALGLDIEFFEHGSYENISSLIIHEVSSLQTIISSGFNTFLRSIVTLLFGIIMLFISNYVLATYTALILGTLTIPIIFIAKKVRKFSKTTKNLHDELSNFTSEKCRNISIIQLFTQEKNEDNIFTEKSSLLTKFAIKSSATRSFLVSLIIMCVMISVGSILWIGIQDVHLGKMNSGEFVSFLFYAFISISSIGHISDISSELQKASRILEKISEFLSTKSTIVNSKNSINITHLKTEIIFKNIDFSYPAKSNVISNASFTVKKGQTVSLVGKSGSGKSTLLKLLMRTYDVSSGAIYIDNSNIKDININSLRSLFGIVPQNCPLFSSSIAENISYGSPNATREAIHSAAEHANCTEFINKLPNAFDSIIGEQGLNLSGGQIQRILIARAILKNPTILLLDEATSSLDPESDYLVRSALNNLMKDRTTIVIAHRLSTISSADLIILMNEGKIETTGTHKQLMQSNYLYNNLVTMQFKNTED